MSSAGYDDVGDSDDFDPKEPTCCDKLSACPGKFSHFLCHRDKGQQWCCLLTPTTWCQLTFFLISLWIISGLFWWGMFELVVWKPTQSLWAFLVCWGLFTALFAVLMSMKLDEDDDSKALGCTEAELKEHIGALMTTGMHWEDYGYKWHIVQKMPLHEDNPSAELNDRIRQVCQRMHYTNTVPVFADELQRGSVLKAKRPDEKGYEHKEEKEVGEVVVTVVQ